MKSNTNSAINRTVGYSLNQLISPVVVSFSSHFFCRHVFILPGTKAFALLGVHVLAGKFFFPILYLFWLYHSSTLLNILLVDKNERNTIRIRTSP